MGVSALLCMSWERKPAELEEVLSAMERRNESIDRFLEDGDDETEW